VGGQEGDSEAGAEVERRDVGQRHHLTGRHDGELLRGATGGTQVRRLPHPGPQAQQRHVDALTDGVDDSGAVLVRNLGRLHRSALGTASTRLPVGGVDARAVDPHPNLAGPRIRDRPIDQGQDVGVTGHGVLDRTHSSTLSSAVQPGA
jgi:hypothetical protein